MAREKAKTNHDTRVLHGPLPPDVYADEAAGFFIHSGT